MDYEINELEPGDVIFHNDPYRGGTHLPEFTMIRPIFYKDEVIAFAANIGHHVDVGGKSPGGFPGDATDIFQEGFRCPPVKLFIRDRENEEVWRIILSNVRTPKISRGDMLAMYKGLLLAERRISELIDKYGIDTVLACFKEIKDYSERRMRSEIDSIPDGCYEAEDFIDDDGVTDGGPYPVRVRVIIDGSDAMVDFTGTSRQVRGPMNCPFGVTASAVYNAFLHITDPTIPTNAGCFRPIKIIAPSGTIVNVDYPAAEFAGNTETHNRIFDVILLALSQSIPAKVAASEGSTCSNFTYGGINPETGETFANYQWDHCGWGARSDKDGVSVVNAPVGNSYLQPIEVNESRFPWIHQCFRLVTDSGGAGKYRGGLGSCRIMTVTAPMIRVSAIADRHKIGAFGLFGGGSGKPGAFLIKRRGEEHFKTFTEVFKTKSPSKFSDIVLHEGDTVLIMTPGGGGYGNPLDRDIEKVVEDVREGYVSIECAKEVYGVEIDPKTFEARPTMARKRREEELKRGGK
jgi:N-methylhydantoinase B/oxoprolinase/acetone carboxylase alpha subunit